MIDLTGNGFRATIATKGATLLEWVPLSSMSEASGSWVDGYESLADLDNQAGVRNGILAPFPNRIANSTFDLDGTLYQFDPVTSRDKTVLHGFLRIVTFDVADISANDDFISIVFRAKIDDDAFAGYPFALEVEVVYLFKNQAIDVSIKAKNLNNFRIPFAAGWHPYFRLPNAEVVDEMYLKVPSVWTIETDQNLIPVRDEYGRQRKQFDDSFNHPRLVGKSVLDKCFTNLQPGPQGVFETSISDCKGEHVLTVWQDRGHMHVFTGDTLLRRPRNSIALEPVEATTNSFNHPELIEELMLHPGQTRVFNFGARVEVNS
ncbi:aldose 1-epimerase [Rhizobium tubonense]|nr:aldose 1-epimerase [Rhizobium tubonense]